MAMANGPEPPAAAEGGAPRWKLFKLFFRDPDNTRDWTIGSYDIVAEASSEEELCDLVGEFSKVFKWGSFFLMRDDIPPLWEHPANADGGCVSFTVPITETSTFVAHSVFGMATGEYDLGPGADINGVSVASKKGYSLVRVWTRRPPSMAACGCIRIPEKAVVHFKPHHDSIRGRKTSLTQQASASLQSSMVPTLARDRRAAGRADRYGGGGGGGGGGGRHGGGGGGRHGGGGGGGGGGRHGGGGGRPPPLSRRDGF